MPNQTAISQKLPGAFSFSEPLIHFLRKEMGANMKGNVASTIVSILLLFLNTHLLNGKLETVLLSLIPWGVYGENTESITVLLQCSYGK